MLLLFQFDIFIKLGLGEKLQSEVVRMGNQWEATESPLDNFEQLVSKSLITCRYRKSYTQVCANQWAGIDGWEGRAPNALYRMFTESFMRVATTVSNGYAFSIFKRSFSRENAADQTTL